MKRTILCTMTAIFCGVTAWADDVRPPEEERPVAAE